MEFRKKLQRHIHNIFYGEIPVWNATIIKTDNEPPRPKERGSSPPTANKKFMDNQ
jgi:hypothetical protein